jgi:hypothetical protein
MEAQAGGPVVDEVPAGTCGGEVPLALQGGVGIGDEEDLIGPGWVAQATGAADVFDEV